MSEYKVSKNNVNRTVAATLLSINDYNKSSQPVVAENTDKTDIDMNNIAICENVTSINTRRNNYSTFTENLRSSLVTECLYKILNESISTEISNTTTGKNIMRAVVSSYVLETGASNILRRMKGASINLSEMYNIIIETENNIRKNMTDNNGTFSITPEMRDEFFKQLNYSDSEAISDAIKERVSDAMNDFVTANAKDHEDITSALKSAQEKIASTNSTQLQESYDYNAKQKINKIKAAPKNLFHAMVTATCEGVLRHQDENMEFIKEGHLDIDKIAERTSIMYTFMEMLNTTKLHKYTTDDISSIIESLKE